MYDNILHKELVMRPGASTAAWSILQALLEKDHTRRLGFIDDFVRYLVLIYITPWWMIVSKKIEVII